MSVAKAIAVLFLMMLMQPLFAQNDCQYRISGTVKSSTKELLIGASVQLEPSGKGVVTDENGSFLVRDLCAGNYKLYVKYLGYKDHVQDVSITKNAVINVVLEPSVFELNEVVVSERPQNTENAQNFSVLSEKDMMRTAGKSLGESLKELTGVNTIQAGPGIFKPVIHGVHSQRVLILNQGVRQEGQQWGAEHAPEIDPFIASNIVVVKDASSIKYGTDAIGGVIIVNAPELPTTGDGIAGSINSVIQSNGRSGTFSGTMEGGIRKHEGWGWRLQGTLKAGGDFKTPDYYLTNTALRESDFSFATGYHSETKGAELFYSHFQSKIGILKGTSAETADDLANAMVREPPEYTRGFSYQIADTDPHQEVSHDLIKLKAHIDKGNKRWIAQYGFQIDNRREFDLRREKLSRYPAIDLQLLTHTVDLERETNRGDNSLCVGVSGMFQDNNNVYGTKRIPFIPNYSSASAGTFGIAKFSSGKWNFDAGARYDFRYYHVAGFDYQNKLFRSSLIFHNVSATFGASLPINKNQTIHLNLSSAWRPPNVAELYSAGTHQSAAAIEYGLLINDSTNEVMDIDMTRFSNEHALKFVGTWQLSNDLWNIEATGYANYIFNYIFLRPFGITKTIRGPAPYFRYRQTDALFVGFDFSGYVHPAKKWQLGMKASLLRASDVTSNDYLVFIPSNRYEWSVRFEEPDKFIGKDFFVEARVKYTAKQSRAPRAIPPPVFAEAIKNGTDPLNGDDSIFDFMAAPHGYTTFHLATGCSIKREKVGYEFRLAADNLFNVSYREYTNRFKYFADDIGSNFTITFKFIF